MRPAGVLLLTALVAAPAAAEVTVRVTPAGPGAASQVELTARAAPLSEVLDRLARQIGMKVVYEGAAPRQLVTLSLQGRSPADTVLGLLEGQGLNYALFADPSGAGVQTLLVAGAAPSATPAAATSAAGRSVTSSPPVRRPSGPPPGSGPDTMESDEEELEDEAFDDPAVSGVQPEGTEGAGADPAQTNPVPTPRAPAAPSPSSPFPVSPFAPQAPPYTPQPYTPQPFPPLPPGVPGGPTSPTTPQQQPETTNPPPLG